MLSVASLLKNQHKLNLQLLSLASCFSACLSKDDHIDSKQVESGEKNSGGKNPSLKL